MVNFRGDRGQKIGCTPTLLLVPDQGVMLESAWEIVNSSGKVDVATNNANFLKGKFTARGEIWLSDANNWWLIDEAKMKSGNGLIWVDKRKREFDKTSDFDSLIQKWRLYGRWGNCHVGWRPFYGHQVS